MRRFKKDYLAAGLLLSLIGMIGYVAWRTRPVPTPRRRWKRFEQPDATPLDAVTCQQLQGIYTIQEGHHFFGRTAVLKCSYTREDERTSYKLSLFCEKNGCYLITEAKKQGDVILLDGHWRRAAANGTGPVRLMLNRLHLQGAGTPQWAIRGYWGEGDEEPSKAVVFCYRQPLPQKPALQIIAHRGGARNVDFLPVSENSVEMLRLAAQLGATGVEIDVRMTKDGVPVLFHDSFLSIHTVKRKLYAGLIHNHTLAQLQQLELRKGGVLPTLQECLHTIVYETPLQTVWLDIKKECDLQKIEKLQAQYLQRAAAIGRNVQIYIGVPDKAVLHCFTSLPDYQSIPSLTEIDAPTATQINAQVWAPQYTAGLPKEEIDAMHAQGRRVFVWSLDNRQLVDLYITEAGFDGLVTNTPSVVAHWYYTANNTAEIEAERQPAGTASS